MQQLKTETENRIAKNLRLFQQILIESGYARTSTGMDASKMKQLEIDIFNLENPKK